MPDDEFPDITACRSCKARMFFARSISTGKAMPFDAGASLLGTFALDRDLLGDWTATYVPPAKHDANEPLFTSHFATCPDAPDWRRNEGKP